jgi:hypothetical protein
MMLQEVMEQLVKQLPQHSKVQFAPHPQLPMAILMQGSGPNSINPAAAGGKQWPTAAAHVSAGHGSVSEPPCIVPHGVQNQSHTQEAAKMVKQQPPCSLSQTWTQVISP